MTIQEVIRAIQNHRGPVLVNAHIFLEDMGWVEVKKGDLLLTLKSARDEGVGGGYSFRVDGADGYYGAWL